VHRSASQSVLASLAACIRQTNVAHTVAMMHTCMYALTYTCSQRDSRHTKHKRVYVYTYNITYMHGAVHGVVIMLLWAAAAAVITHTESE
jgi:hypothetical protein